MLKAPATKPGQKKRKEKVSEINAVNFSIIDGLGRQRGKHQEWKLIRARFENRV